LTSSTISCYRIKLQNRIVHWYYKNESYIGIPKRSYKPDINKVIINSLTMKIQTFVITASLLLVLGTFVFATPAAFANPCSNTSSIGSDEKTSNNDGNCHGGKGGSAENGGNGATGGKGGTAGYAANAGNSGNSAGADRAANIIVHGGDASGGKGGNGGDSIGGKGGSVNVCNSLGKVGVSCS
jgi:hypothetical protein